MSKQQFEEAIHQQYESVWDFWHDFLQTSECVVGKTIELGGNILKIVDISKTIDPTTFDAESMIAETILEYVMEYNGDLIMVRNAMCSWNGDTVSIHEVRPVQKTVYEVV